MPTPRTTLSSVPTTHVIPAKAGIHEHRLRLESESLRFWIPAFAGMTREESSEGCSNFAKAENDTIPAKMAADCQAMAC